MAPTDAWQPVPTEEKSVPVDRLDFDPENPRLAPLDLEGMSQEELLEALCRRMSIEELALSIAHNGYFDHEPLLVLEGEDEHYIVVEGNRRLAAVKTLLDDQLRDTYLSDDVPDLNDEHKEEIRELPVLVYESREKLWQYTGFRHVNGVKPWDSYSKAKYVVEVHESYDVSLDDLADRIGDTHTTVKRLYLGYKILRQAEEETEFHHENRTKSHFSFSHLYTAVDNSTFQSFLGIEDPESPDNGFVPESHLDELDELMIWLYGDEQRDKEPVIARQNPDLWELRRIIEDPQALDALRSGYSREKAHQIAYGDERRFREALTSAKEELMDARGAMHGYGGEEDLLETAETIDEISTEILEDMRERQDREGDV